MRESNVFRGVCASFHRVEGGRVAYPGHSVWGGGEGEGIGYILSRYCLGRWVHPVQVLSLGWVGYILSRSCLGRLGSGLHPVQFLFVGGATSCPGAVWGEGVGYILSCQRDMVPSSELYSDPPPPQAPRSSMIWTWGRVWYCLVILVKTYVQ